MNGEEKIGVINNWNDPRGFGIVRVGDRCSLERYFLHVSRIKSGTAMPMAGMTVRFRVSPNVPAEGQLPAALDAHIDVDSVDPAPSQGGVN